MARGVGCKDALGMAGSGRSVGQLVGCCGFSISFSGPGRRSCFIHPHHHSPSSLHLDMRSGSYRASHHPCFLLLHCIIPLPPLSSRSSHASCLVLIGLPLPANAPHLIHLSCPHVTYDLPSRTLNILPIPILLTVEHHPHHDSPSFSLSLFKFWRARTLQPISIYTVTRFTTEGSPRPIQSKCTTNGVTSSCNPIFLCGTPKSLGRGPNVGIVATCMRTAKPPITAACRHATVNTRNKCETTSTLAGLQKMASRTNRTIQCACPARARRPAMLLPVACSLSINVPQLHIHDPTLRQYSSSCCSCCSGRPFRVGRPRGAR